MDRREFSKKVVTGSAAMGMSPLILTGPGWKGANDRVNVAVLGIRAQGQEHIREYQKLNNVNVAALCDPDSNLFEERVKKYYTDRGLPKPKLYTDLRKLYEDRDIDAVSVVTQNHWHALASI
ncbi:MAG TPA: Gfo/Idh/MocA family oxidoreductase, partial [Bacteroidales bacterium]|nr:Gfo/Idh/MocA family oxidoreductase [Bacteroidales bacterium]